MSTHMSPYEHQEDISTILRMLKTQVPSLQDTPATVWISLTDAGLAVRLQMAGLYGHLRDLHEHKIIQ